MSGEREREEERLYNWCSTLKDSSSLLLKAFEPVIRSGVLVYYLATAKIGDVCLFCCYRNTLWYRTPWYHFSISIFSRNSSLHCRNSRSIQRSQWGLSNDTTIGIMDIVVVDKRVFEKILSGSVISKGVTVNCIQDRSFQSGKINGPLQSLLIHSVDVSVIIHYWSLANLPFGRYDTRFRKG